MTKRTLVTLLAGLLAAVPALADEKQELLKLKQEIAGEREQLLELKNTATNLIDIFVQQGLLDKQKAAALMKSAKSKAAIESQQPAAPTPPTAAEDTASPPKTDKPKSIRFAYVPEFVKEEIRQEVIAGLTGKVVTEVKADAKKEKWGIPGALPEWLDNIKISGDIRLRFQDDMFGAMNNPTAYPDYLSINQDGGPLAAHNKNQEFLNTTKDRLRFAERVRINVESQVTDSIKAGVRLTTTNDLSPVSNNQTLGNNGKTYQVAMDRAFIQYDYIDSQKNDWVTLSGGRIANPWMSTEMMYSPELSFEGFVGHFRWHMNQNDPTVKHYSAAPANSRFGVQVGPSTPDALFLTLGAFPLQEVNFSTTDKWLFGGQMGGDWLVHNDSRLKLATAYYDYENISARANANDSFTYDWTAPQFMQKGNTLVPINAYNGVNGRCTSSQLSIVNSGCLFGLASDFKIFNTTLMYDFADFAPTHIMMTVDYAKNLGYNANAIARNFPNYFTGQAGGDNKDHSNAFQVRFDIGHPEIRRFKDWSAILSYRYLQRDAVLDAFTDTVFHQGGTDAKGWMVGGNYGLAKNTWMLLRWYSTQAIDGPPLDINTVTLDLNLRM